MSDILIYGIFTCGANFLVAGLVSLLLQWFIMPLKPSALVIHSLLFAGTFIGIMALFYRLYREKIHGFYQPNQNNKFLPKTVLALVLPGEILRFLLCLISIGSGTSTGTMSVIPTVLFEQIYLLRWTDRYAIVRGGGSVIALDVVAYIACYLIYFAVYFGALTAILWFVWNSRKKGRKALGIEDSN